MSDIEKRNLFARFHDPAKKRGAEHSGLWYMTHPNKRSTPKDIIGHHGHKPHGPSILWPALYEHLRAKGYSKEKAARISNAAWDKKKIGLKTNTPTSAKGLIKSEATVTTDKRHEDGDHSSTLSSYPHESEAVPMGTKTISKDDLDPEVVSYIEVLEDEVASQAEELVQKDSLISELQASDLSKSDDDEAFKSMIEKADPAVRVVLEKQRTELKAQREQIEKAAAEQSRREFISKAAAIPNIAAPADDVTVADILQTVHEKAGPETAEQVEKMLKAADEQISKGALFSEMGSSGGLTTTSSEVEAKVAEIQKADPSLTREQAEAQAYELDPALYTAAMNKEN